MNVTSNVPASAATYSMAAPAAADAPIAAGATSAIDVLTENPRSPWGGGAGYLFKNLETFPGQLLYTPPKMSKRSEDKLSRTQAVRAARHAERTSEHIRGGIDAKTDMVVGATLRVHPQPDWESLGFTGKDDWKTKKPFAQACAREFNNWAYDTRLLQDGEGHYNFGGMMWLAYRNVVGPDAECAGLIHYDQDRADAYNARWATYVTIIDPDRIETPAKFATDRNVYEGKRMDKDGRMTSMYVRNTHPSDGATEIEDTEYSEVPRETAWGRPMSFHYFVKTRGGQQRGVTNLVTVLRKIGMLDSFDDAYLGAAVVNQVLSNYIETASTAEQVAEQMAPKGKDGESIWDSKLTYYKGAKISIGGTRVPVMPPGDKIMMSAVNRAIGDPSSFRNGFLREFASALGISFEQVSKNFSEANYSSARAALLEVWRGILSARKMFTAHVASLIYGAVIEEAIYKGRIELPAGAPPFQENRSAYTACAWTGPGMGWIDPLKEATAMQILVEKKFKSRQQIVAEMDGGDYLETFDQIEQENIEAEERDFVLDPLMPGQAATLDPNAGDAEETGGSGGSSTAQNEPAPAPQFQDA